MPRILRAGLGNHFPELSAQIRITLIVAVIIYLAALAGIFSRPTGFLAAFWPANAILAGCLVRFGRRARLFVLLGAVFGYQAAGFSVGDDPWPGLHMTAGNIVSASTFAFVFTGLESGARMLTSPRSLISLLGAAIIASAAAGVVGGSVVSGLSGTSYFDGWATWFAADLMNLLVLMPVLLTMPWPLRRLTTDDLSVLTDRSVLSPMGLLVLSFALSALVPHPLAIAFPVPALVWCALVLPMPMTCILVLIYSGLAMVGVKLNLFEMGLDGGFNDQGIAAVHFGVALIALGPVLVAAANVERRQLLDQLERAALHDDLTGTLNRHAFMTQGGGVLAELQDSLAPVAVFLVDADHFKQVNDTYGHAAGDRALVALSAAVRLAIRQGDILGRLGGEEFALILPGAAPGEAKVVAERLRQMVEDLQVVLDSGDVLRLSVSVGVVAAASSAMGLPEMLSLADRAMYEAKRMGRNRVQMYDQTLS